MTELGFQSIVLKYADRVVTVFVKKVGVASLESLHQYSD